MFVISDCQCNVQMSCTRAYRNCKPLLIRSWQQSLGGSTSSTGFKFNFSLSNNNNKVKWSHKTLKKQTTKTFLQFF